MAKLLEIIEVERNRQEQNQWNVIHLFKEGGFYRAYEWSSWLISVFSYNDDVRKQTEDRKPIVVTRKPIKNTDDTYCFVGFPLKSVEKFIPVRTDFTPVSDSQIDIAIMLPQSSDGTEQSYELLQEAFATWKDSLPISAKPEKPEKAERTAGISQAPIRTMTGIMAQVLAYPLEMKTPLENTQFISDLKQELAALL